MVMWLFPLYGIRSGRSSASLVPHSLTMGECLPSARSARYFSINYPDFSPRFTQIYMEKPPK